MLEAADQLDGHGNKKARGIIAMAKVIVVCNTTYCPTQNIDVLSNTMLGLGAGIHAKHGAKGA